MSDQYTPPPPPPPPHGGGPRPGGYDTPDGLPPPPPPQKGGGGCLKLALIGCGGLILLGILFSVGIGIWMKRGGVEKMQEMEQQAIAFGRQTDEAGCEARAAQILKEQGLISGAVTGTIWLQTCLKNSRETAGYCDGVPDRPDNQWAAQRCSAAGLTGTACGVLAQGVVEYCSAGQPKEGTAASELPDASAEGGGTWADSAAAPAEAP